MGEIIKKISEIQIGNTKLDIELNEAERRGGDEIIHVQNNRVRYAFEKTEFVQMLTLILSARDYLKHYKGIDDV